jgi:hypothetical protein
VNEERQPDCFSFHGRDISIKKKKTLQSWAARFFLLFYEQRGWEKFFHGQTKGYMFACDQLHVKNISRNKHTLNRCKPHFTGLSKTKNESVTAA